MSDDFNFEAECLRTASNEFHGELVPMAELRRRLHNFVQAADELDYVKKLLFYGEDASKNRVSLVRTQDLGKPNTFSALFALQDALPLTEPQPLEWLLHGIIGGATEKGELAEALLKALNGEELDAVNVREEIFDGQWYDALICVALGVTFDEGQRNIIDKLRKRFPDKFTETAANNRDLDGERAVLEGDQREYAGVRFEAEERLFILKAEATVAAMDEAAEKEAAGRSFNRCGVCGHTDGFHAEKCDNDPVRKYNGM